MNRQYYGRIYLNPHPTPLDMSFLDNDEFPDNLNDYAQQIIIKADTLAHAVVHSNEPCYIAQASVSSDNRNEKQWLKIEADIQADNMWQAYLNTDLALGDTVKHSRVRLFSPIAKANKMNSYVFWMSVPRNSKKSDLKLSITSPFGTESKIEKVTVTRYYK